jgi:hypothetical protein
MGKNINYIIDFHFLIEILEFKIKENSLYFDLKGPIYLSKIKLFFKETTSLKIYYILLAYNY